LEALKDRTDVLIIATTVAVEVVDIPDLVVPSNTRIAKFVPYDLLLPQVRLRKAFDIAMKRKLTYSSWTFS
jgi:hypothetical protein